MALQAATQEPDPIDQHSAAPMLRPVATCHMSGHRYLSGGWSAVLSAMIVSGAVSPWTASAAPIALDPATVISGQNHLITSSPSTFTGANVANLIGANRFYSAGITGQNTISANVEAGQVWNGHESLQHVTNFVTPAGALQTVAGQPEFDRHATWVGMMIGGRNGGAVQGAWQPGIAPQTDLRSGAIATSWAGNAYSLSFFLTTATMAGAYGAFFGSADVINSSWGGTDPSGSSNRATITDGLANQNRTTTFVVSAGNAGPGANTVGSPGSAYNNITVAALQNNGSNVYNSVATFSSRGPQSWYNGATGAIVTGVRAAVDIAAPGTTLTSAFYGGQTGGNNPTRPGSVAQPGSNFYSGGLGGTSFAAPITAGGVALLDSASKADAGLAGNINSRDARVVKAVLMNSADKIPGWNNGQANVGGVIQTTQSLDWASGAGALNLDRAYDQYITAGTRDVAGLGGGTVEEVGWDYGEVAIGQSNRYLIDDYLLGGSVFTVTLDWFRERTFSLTGLTAQDIGEANLDLIITDLISNTVIAQSISLYNDVEHLSFLLPSTSRYAIDVRYVSNLFGSLVAEQYGLAWNSTATVPIPGTLSLLLWGLLGVGLARRRSTLARNVA